MGLVIQKCLTVSKGITSTAGETAPLLRAQSAHPSSILRACMGDSQLLVPPVPGHPTAFVGTVHAHSTQTHSADKTPTHAE